MGSKLVDFLNREVKKYIRWCTPSVILEAERVEDIYGTDVSASLSIHGIPGESSGIFHEAQEKAARLYGADMTLFSVHGSTGSVYVAMRYLSLAYGTPLVLVTRNIHVSVQNACEDFGIRYRFIPSQYDEELDAFIPPTPEDVEEALRKHPEANAVLISNPTYEGLSCKLREIVARIRNFSREILVIVDEAWGSHFRFSDRLPETAMEAGADISIQSTHKQGGSLQQTGMIHWKRDRVDSDLMMEAYRGYMTTSPSFHLMASLDAARSYLERNGRKAVESVIKKAEMLRERLKEIPNLKIMDDELLDKWRDRISGWDLTKTQVILTSYDTTGFQLDLLLQEKYRVVPETSNYNSILFMATFQLREEDISATAEAVRRALSEIRTVRNKELLRPPLRADPPVIDPYIVRRMPKRIISRRVPLRLAPGMISAENITPYPPGVPILIRGFRISAEDINYLLTVKRNGGILLAKDPSLATVEVIYGM